MIKILNVLILAALSLGRETAWSTAMIPLAVFHPKLWSLHRIGGAAEWTGVCGQHYCDKVDCMLTGWRGYWVMGVQTTVCRWWGALLLARVTSIHYASRNLARVTASSILTSHINDWWIGLSSESFKISLTLFIEFAFLVAQQLYIRLSFLSVHCP